MYTYIYIYIYIHTYIHIYTCSGGAGDPAPEGGAGGNYPYVSFFFIKKLPLKTSKYKKK